MNDVVEVEKDSTWYTLKQLRKVGGRLIMIIMVAAFKIYKNALE